MKNVCLLFLTLIFTAKAISQRQSAEIYFQQDSILPNEIKAYVKMIAEPDNTGSIRDSLNIDWGDGSQTWITLTDTAQISGLSFPLYEAIYTGNHLYNSPYFDSIVAIGCIAYWPREQGILNIGTSNNIKMFISAEINFPILRNMRGYKSPYFSAPLYLIGYTNDIWMYNPLLTPSNSLTTKTKFTIPLQAYNIFVPGYSSANKVFPYAADTLLICDSVSGNISWNYPLETGLYDITLKCKQYQNDTIVSSIMLDMVVAIVNASTGIDKTAINAMTISPNPATDRLIVSVPIDKIDVTISDMSGRVIDAPVSGNQINVSALSSGVYCLRLQNSNAIKVRRFVRE